jgi:hypothetical protein
LLRKRPHRSARISALLALGVTTALLAAGPSAAARPSHADALEARTICISERGAGDPFRARQFRLLYGDRRAFRRCIRFHVRQVVIQRRLRLPSIWAECRSEALSTPVKFRLSFPGGLHQCVRFEALP